MANGDNSGEKKGSGGLVGIVAVTLLAAGAGGGFGFFLSSGLKWEDEKKPATQHAENEKPKAASAVRVIALAPIIANLTEPKTAWMRVEASLVVEGEIEGESEGDNKGADALGAKIAEDIVAYLKTTTLAQFEGASGFQNLREDLNDRARVRGGSQVRELVLHGVVVE